MAEPPSEAAVELRRICSQLLRQQQRALTRLTELKEDLQAPTTKEFLDALRAEAGDVIPEGIIGVLAKVEEALSAVEFCHSEIHRELVAPRAGSEGSNGFGPQNLPPALVRFLAERADTPGFTYDVRSDPVRGWIIRWKEYTGRGTVRGSGQFYERPYAWL